MLLIYLYSVNSSLNNRNSLWLCHLNKNADSVSLTTEHQTFKKLTSKFPLWLCSMKENQLHLDYGYVLCYQGTLILVNTPTLGLVRLQDRLSQNETHNSPHFCLVGQHILFSVPAKLVIHLLHDSTLSFAPPFKERKQVSPKKNSMTTKVLLQLQYS